MTPQQREVWDRSVELSRSIRNAADAGQLAGELAFELRQRLRRARAQLRHDPRGTDVALAEWEVEDVAQELP